jgi:hypothetical protein
MAGAKLKEIRILDTFRSLARRRMGTLVGAIWRSARSLDRTRSPQTDFPSTKARGTSSTAIAARNAVAIEVSQHTPLGLQRPVDASVGQALRRVQVQAAVRER